MSTKIYEGSSSSSSKILFTVKDGKIYQGDSTSSSRMVANVNGWLDEEEFAAIVTTLI